MGVSEEYSYLWLQDIKERLSLADGKEEETYVGLFEPIWGGKSAVVSTCRKHTLPFSPASAK